MRKLLVADASLAPDAAFFAPEMREVSVPLASKDQDSTAPYCAAVLVITVN
jgi:hypothetical protein